MEKPLRRVYFDTNSYIGTKDGWDEILAAEAARGITKAANHYVAQELIRRLADQDVRERGKGLAGIKRLFKHCARPTDLPILVPREVSLLRMVYRATEAGDTLQDAYVRVLNECANVEPEDWSPELTEFIKVHADQAARQKESIRARFAEQRSKLDRIMPRIQAENPDVKPRAVILDHAARIDQTRMIANGHIQRTIESVGRPVSEEEQGLIADVMTKVWAVPLEHERRIRFGHFATAREQPNDILDNLILYSVYENPLSDDLPIQLVTKERRILEVLEAVPSTGILSLNDYLVQLGLPHLQQKS